MYTWSDCTLERLSHLIADAEERVLPSPAVGARLVFRLIFADTRARADGPPKYVTKDIGSVVIGEGGPGAQVADTEPPTDRHKTLADARFITGDYISCAILPPNEVTGDVQPASAARTGRGSGVGEARTTMGDAPPPPSRRGFNGPPGGVFYDDRGYRGGRRPTIRGGGRGGGGARIPQGDWRRGDDLPYEAAEGDDYNYCSRRPRGAR